MACGFHRACGQHLFGVEQVIGIQFSLHDHALTFAEQVRQNGLVGDLKALGLFKQLNAIAPEHPDGRGFLGWRYTAREISAAVSNCGPNYSEFCRRRAKLM